MTNEQIEAIESITLSLAGGVAVIYPPSAPVVALVKGVLSFWHESGIQLGTPYELSAEQAAAIAAGLAAAKASAVTSYKENHEKKLPSDKK